MKAEFLRGNLYIDVHSTAVHNIQETKWVAGKTKFTVHMHAMDIVQSYRGGDSSHNVPGDEP